MEQKQITQLMVAMGRYGMKKLCIKQEGFEISLEREGVENPCVCVHENAPHVGMEKHLTASTMGAEHEKKDQSTSSVEDASLYVSSPMVGTFYRAASPSDAPFVRPGDKIEENTVVCLVEAMKVMNEVKAGVRGIVAEVLIENAQPVEFGAKLFKITPVI